MYRTDKQFMTNPATASSRIYIGFLPKTVVSQDLEEKFKVHGRILGLVLQQGFAFIQYEQEHQAHTAIESENFTMLHGRKITVKQALDKSQKSNQNQPNQKKNQGGPQHFQQQQQNKPQQQVPRPPQQQQQQQNLQPPQRPPQQQNQQQTPPPPPQQQNKPPLLNLPGPPPNQQQQPQQKGPPTPNQDQDWGRGPSQSQQEPPLTPNSRNFPQNDDNAPSGPPNKNDGPYNFESKRGKKRRLRGNDRERFGGPPGRPGGRQGGAGGGYNDDSYYQKAPYNAPVPPINDQPDRNDCEIIVVSKLLTKYAEYIEQRLKSLGLIVDLLFPNEDVPIGRVLANISSRGCLYAILIMPQNEEHRSLTLNVLHGIPQEHRNMPIEDSLIFIMRNFDAYMRGDKTAIETLGPGGVMNISDRHPTNIQLLLNLLAENRQITTVQYDRLLKYLQERKEVQLQHEVTEGGDQDSQGSNTKQAELQSRIMNILNKSTEAPPAAPVAVVEPPPPAPIVSSAGASAPPPLLKDPSVQKALDSLLGGEMFKSMSSSM